MFPLFHLNVLCFLISSGRVAGHEGWYLRHRIHPGVRQQKHESKGENYKFAAQNFEPLRNQTGSVHSVLKIVKVTWPSRNAVRPSKSTVNWEPSCGRWISEMPILNFIAWISAFSPALRLDYFSFICRLRQGRIGLLPACHCCTVWIAWFVEVRCAKAGLKAFSPGSAGLSRQICFTWVLLLITYDCELLFDRNIRVSVQKIPWLNLWDNERFLLLCRSESILWWEQ